MRLDKPIPVSPSLPAAVSTGLIPILISHVRVSVTEVLETRFVAAARSFGISDARILFRWVLPASLNALISLFGLSVGMLLSSSLVVEGVFAWPGLGQLMLQAIVDRDVFLIVDSAVIAASLLLVGNLAADVLLCLSDPRIRTV
jgi:peptide/nickel transport system permease protein